MVIFNSYVKLPEGISLEIQHSLLFPARCRKSRHKTHRRRDRRCGAPFANIWRRGMMSECQWLYGYPFLHTLDMGYLLLHQEIKWTLKNMCQTHQTFLWIKGIMPCSNQNSWLLWMFTSLLSHKGMKQNQNQQILNKTMKTCG